MDNALTYKVLTERVGFLVSELKNTDLNRENPFKTTRFLKGFREPILEDAIYELGMTKEIPKYDLRIFFNNNMEVAINDSLASAFYLDFYLENKYQILDAVRSELGLNPEDPDSWNKKVFLQGLQELLEKTNSGFLDDLNEYLSNSEYLLDEIKKYLGISAEDDTFDSELSILCKSGYAKFFEMINSDEIETVGLQNYLYNNIFKYMFPNFANMVAVGKEWLYLYVKLSFDPPTASTLTYLKERLNELEWYIVNYNLGDWIYGEQKHAGSETSWN